VRGLFVTGTDTGAGKTFVAAALAAALCERGLDLGVMKPAASGCRRIRGELVSDDALRLARAARSRDPRELISPERFAAPVAPSVAARLAGRRIALPRIARAFRELSRRHGFVLVEGVGGLLAPLSERLLVADLAAGLGLPLLVVAANRLGCVNHTLLTLAEARRRRLTVWRTVLSDVAPDRSDRSRRTNASEIARLSGLPVFGLPHCRSLSEAARRLRPLATEIAHG
jgi:dethiobiotin synthetase